jgi:hypothetical protein
VQFAIVLRVTLRLPGLSGEFRLKLSTAEQRRVRRVAQRVETAPLPLHLNGLRSGGSS